MTESQVIAQCLRTAAALVEFAATLAVRLDRPEIVIALTNNAHALRVWADSV